jgi:hypothetical protein
MAECNLKAIKKNSGSKPLIATFSIGKKDFAIECSMRDLTTLQKFRQLVGDQLGVFFELTWISSGSKGREEWNGEVADAFERGSSTK